MEQRIAVLVSAVLGAFLLGLFAAIARSAKSPASAEDIAVAGARWRRTVFWTLTLLFVPVIGYSLTKMPYTSAAQPAAAVTVQVSGQQWAWTVSPDTVPVGQPVEIRVTGADCSLERLYVVPEARKGGVGGALIDHVMQAAREGGGTGMELWSDKRFGDAHRLYGRYGAEVVGERLCDDAEQSPEWGLLLPL